MNRTTRSYLKVPPSLPYHRISWMTKKNNNSSKLGFPLLIGLTDPRCRYSDHVMWELRPQIEHIDILVRTNSWTLIALTDFGCCDLSYHSHWHKHNIEHSFQICWRQVKSNFNIFRQTLIFGISLPITLMHSGRAIKFPLPFLTDIYRILKQDKFDVGGIVKVGVPPT